MNRAATESLCPVCAAPLRRGLAAWHRVCAACGYEGSTLQPRIGAAGPRLDEAGRSAALEALRRRNFARLARLLRTMAKAGPEQRPRLLDVGSAQGWFLEAVAADFDALGIEPDAAVAAAPRARGLPVRLGYFPDALAADECFDLITFNDALEHLPDLDAAFAACRRHLRPGGVLMVNAPDRRGVLYRTAKRLARLGRPAAFERLWQVGFPSPHLHYLDDAALRALAARHGMAPQLRRRLPSVGLAGLKARVGYGGGVSPLRATALAAALAAAIPLLGVLPADIGVWFFRRIDESF